MTNRQPHDPCRRALILLIPIAAAGEAQTATRAVQADLSQLAVSLADQPAASASLARFVGFLSRSRYHICLASSRFPLRFALSLATLIDPVDSFGLLDRSLKATARGKTSCLRGNLARHASIQPANTAHLFYSVQQS
jgi:hypothetical protein